ncbi:MAG TPA: hypothetical protein VFZ97_08045, partial [Acidimicrobiales bacterium]
GTVSDSTWVWNGSTWTDYSPAQIEEPPGRYLASMAFDPALHQLILFGGRNGAGHQLDDTWAWNGASWYNIGGRPGSTTPSSRDGATLAYDGQGHLLLFGGEGTASAVPANPTASPTQSTAAGVATLGERSGTAQTNATAAPLIALGDTWQWSSGGWSQINVPGPTARTNAAASYDQAHGAVVVFGGASGPSGAPGTVQLADTWTWNGSAWSQTPPTSGPAARSFAVMADDPIAGGVVLAGGSSGGAPLGDTWTWNGSGWSQLSTNGTAAMRTAASGAYDTATGELVVFGGTRPDGGLLNTTVVLAAGAPLPLGSAPSPGTTVTLPGSQTTSTTTSVPSTTPGATAPGPQRSRALSPGGNRQAPTRSNSVPVLRPGQLVTLTGSGFSPNVELTLTFHSTPALVGKTLTDAHGAFVATVSVPLKASNGTHHFDASGLTASGPADLVVATVRIVAAASSSSPSLAETVALVLVALGLPLGTWLLLGYRGRIRERIS